MKYCPYCGTVLVDGAVSFCSECGKALPVSGETKEKQEKTTPSGQRREPEPRQEERHGKKSRRRESGKPHAAEKKTEKEMDVPEEKKTGQPEPLPHSRQQPEPPAATDSTEPGDDYDGYYDDVLPEDEGRFSEGIDRGLVKKIILIIGVVLLVVGACVLMMYLL